MITFKRILFPVDFSAESRAVAPSVKAMASRFSSDIVVMHVVDLPPAWFGSPEAAGWAALINADGMRQAARVGLDRFIEQEFSGVPVIGEIAQGDPASQIVDFAGSDPGTLVMMPTRGYGPLRALLLGSVTAKVLHDTRCPVWTGAHAPEITVAFAREVEAHAVRAGRRRQRLAGTQVGGQFASEQRMELRLVHAVPGTNAPVLEENVPIAFKFLFDVAREQLAKMQASAGNQVGLMPARWPGRTRGSCSRSRPRCRLHRNRKRSDAGIVRTTA